MGNSGNHTSMISDRPHFIQLHQVPPTFPLSTTPHPPRQFPAPAFRKPTGTPAHPTTTRLRPSHSVRVTTSRSLRAATGPAKCSYDPNHATRTTSPPPQIIGCSYVAANAFRWRGMNQLGVHSHGTTSGEDRVFNIKVSTRPTVARNRTQTQWQPRRPNGKRVCEYRAKVPIHSRRRRRRPESRHLAGARAQYLWGR
jgi:hypothetical protein